MKADSEICSEQRGPTRGLVVSGDQEGNWGQNRKDNDSLEVGVEQEHFMSKT